MGLNCHLTKVVNMVLESNQIPHIHQLEANDSYSQEDEDFHSDPFL